MEYRQYIEFLHKIEKLKCHTRHSWNSEGKRESVAEHSWRLSTEARAVRELVSSLPTDMADEFIALYDEMDALETPEAKLFKALDNMEAVVSHNEASLDTWIPLEFTENMVYGEKAASFSEWTGGVRAELRRESEEKVARAVENGYIIPKEE